MIAPERRRVVAAARIELAAPLASFRDPMFPGVTRCLPVPPLSTLRGMLAAATGRVSEYVQLGVCARPDGRGVDPKTSHPVASEGRTPAVAGRVARVKGGMTIRARPFLSRVHITLWIPDPEADRIVAALRRPVWGLRLGRSQDLVHIPAIAAVTLHPADEAGVGHALAVARGDTRPPRLIRRRPRNV